MVNDLNWVDAYLSNPNVFLHPQIPSKENLIADSMINFGVGRWIQCDYLHLGVSQNTFQSPIIAMKWAQPH